MLPVLEAEQEGTVWGFGAWIYLPLLRDTRPPFKDLQKVLASVDGCSSHS